jgi:hypothetical protein
VTAHSGGKLLRPIGHAESDAILGAVRQVAVAHGGPITHADTASVTAAARNPRGRDITVDIFGPDWQVWGWAERDLEELRAALGVTPAGGPR